MGLCGDACQLGSLKPCHGSSVCTWLSQRLCRTEGVALCLSLERQPVHSPALEKKRRQDLPLAAGRESFMGVMKPLPEQLDVASVFMTPAGIIASVSRGFSNLFGHSASDIIGGSVSHSNGPAPYSWHRSLALCSFRMRLSHAAFKSYVCMSMLRLRCHAGQDLHEGPNIFDEGLPACQGGRTGLWPVCCQAQARG